MAKRGISHQNLAAAWRQREKDWNRLADMQADDPRSRNKARESRGLAKKAASKAMSHDEYAKRYPGRRFDQKGKQIKSPKAPKGRSRAVNINAPGGRGVDFIHSRGRVHMHTYGDRFQSRSVSTKHIGYGAAGLAVGAGAAYGGYKLYQHHQNSRNAKTGVRSAQPTRQKPMGRVRRKS